MWGIIFGHFGACWGYYTLFTQMPTYLKDIQHLDLKTVGGNSTKNVFGKVKKIFFSVIILGGKLPRGQFSTQKIVTFPFADWILE